MHVQFHELPSKHLNKNFQFKQYGNSGKVLFLFPCSEGNFWDHEDRGIIHLLSPFILEGRVTVFTLSSVDKDSWYSHHRSSHMGKNHEAYEKCVVSEVVPFVHKLMKKKEKIILSGNSWGGYHTINFILKHPTCFDGAIALSGVYSLKSLIGDYYDDHVYFNDPLKYLPDLKDEKHLSELQKSFIVISHGGGLWEDHRDEAWRLASLLGIKAIPHAYVPWGADWNHDWPTWRAQLPFYLHEMLLKFGY